MRKAKFIFALVIGITCAATGLNALAQIQFTETTTSAGIDYNGESWSASWGDMNADARPDIYVSNHRLRSSFYRNNGDGTFTDVVLQADTAQALSVEVGNDTHGGAWADFDNDGDQDILISTGSCCIPYLFVNDGTGTFTEESVARSIQNDGGGRHVTWFDYTRDGLLDMAVGSTFSARVHRQETDNTFTKVTGTDASGSCGDTEWAILIDFDNDGDEEIICIRTSFPINAFDMIPPPFVDVTSSLPFYSNVADTASGDFDGDLDQDLLLVRGRMTPSQALLLNDNKIEAYISTGTNDKGIEFTHSGVITVLADSRQYNASRINIGSAGVHPVDITFTLDSSDPSTHGIAPYVPSDDNDRGLYVGYDNVRGVWQMFLAPGTKNARTYIVVDSTTVMSNLTTLLFASNDVPIQSALLMNNAAGYEDESSTRGLGEDMYCNSAVAADYDNDMDLDLYFVCRGGVENIRNRLYENDGLGNFTEVLTTYGAEGAIGAGLASNAGVGDVAILADYDLDGWMDLHVTNGRRLRPVDVGGPDQLFRNTTANGNNWIELDLIGSGPPSGSNRDGIGAQIIATAGGVSQYREQNNGIHRHAQDFQRIHFGLGSNTTVDITITWPSGTVDNFTAVASNTIYQAHEGGTIDPLVLGPVPQYPAPQLGDECGTPAFDAQSDMAVFLYKDCTTDIWSVRVAAANSPTNVVQQGEVISDMGFTSVTGFDLEGGDKLDENTDPNILDYNVKVINKNVDGFDFELPINAESCISPSSPSGIQLLVGPRHLIAPLPFNLSTFATCLSLNIDDVTVDESASTATFTVSLSDIPGMLVTVDYTTADVTALTGSDYIAASGSLSFDPVFNETSKTITVPIIDDGIGEGVESFEVLLSNATNASIADTVGIGTINDNDANACGEPTIDAAVDKAVFIWQDCEATGDPQWFVRTSGGSSNPAIIYEGLLSATENFISVIPFSIENSDVLDYSTDPSQIVYLQRVANTGKDGFDFIFPASASVCFDASVMPAGAQVLIGDSRFPMPTQFELTTLGSCSSLSIVDVSVNEGDGTATFSVSLSSASSHVVTADFDTVDGSATVGADYTASSGTVSFPIGSTVPQNIIVPILEDSISEGAEYFSVNLSNAMNATIADGVGVGTIDDNEISACGEPDFDKAVEQDIFLWQDCNASGNPQWFLRATAGGNPILLTYDGDITADQAITNLTLFSIEGNDTVDNVTDPNQILFQLNMKNTGQDGFDFEYPTGASVCFDVTALPAGSRVLVGAGKTEVTTPFNLDNFGNCP